MKLLEATLVALMLLVGRATPVTAGSLEDAQSAAERGDYAEALRSMRPLAEQGNVVAEFDLGLMYEHGRGVPRDYVEALRWYRRAAEQGHTAAQTNLGAIYANGQGVPQDYAEAVRWYRKAAEHGDGIAQSNLGKAYDQGGHGVPQDYVEAARWYRLAAEQGNADAQFNLAVMYGTGKGVPQDYVQAHRWFNLAAAQYPTSGDERRARAIKNRDLIAAKMTMAQIAEAQMLARDWKPTPPPSR